MGPPKSYASDFKRENHRKNIFVVSQAIGVIRSIVALRSGRRRVRSPSAKYRHQTIPIRKRGAMSGLNLHFARADMCQHHRHGTGASRICGKRTGSAGGRDHRRGSLHRQDGEGSRAADGRPSSRSARSWPASTSPREAAMACARRERRSPLTSTAPRAR